MPLPAFHSGGEWEKVGRDGRKSPTTPMFRGAAKVTLDDKGRMVLPTRYRERLLDRSGGQLIVTVDRDGQCLLLYPLTDWEPVEKQLMALPTLDPQSRRLQRLMVGHATDLPLDGHGRILLTQELREFAGLQRHAMLIGQGNRCELWDETRWMERRDGWLKDEAAANELPAHLDSLSL
jgi:MraZ protein